MFGMSCWFLPDEIVVINVKYKNKTFHFSFDVFSARIMGMQVCVDDGYESFCGKIWNKLWHVA